MLRNTVKNVSFGILKHYFWEYFVYLLPRLLILHRYAFFNKQHFYKQPRLNLAKNQPNAKQHLEVELLLFENYSHSSSTLSSKNNSYIF